VQLFFSSSSSFTDFLMDHSIIPVAPTTNATGLCNAGKDSSIIGTQVSNSESAVGQNQYMLSAFVFH
jgi:hypothetical protein